MNFADFFRTQKKKEARIYQVNFSEHFRKIGSEQKRPGANRPPGFSPESPVQKGVSGVHIVSNEL